MVLIRRSFGKLWIITRHKECKNSFCFKDFLKEKHFLYFKIYFKNLEKKNID